MGKVTARGAAARQIETLARRLAEEMEDGNWTYARDTSRAILGVASKCLQRAKTVMELEADGYAAAEVDRAVSRNGQVS